MDHNKEFEKLIKKDRDEHNAIEVGVGLDAEAGVVDDDGFQAAVGLGEIQAGELVGEGVDHLVLVR